MLNSVYTNSQIPTILNKKMTAINETKGHATNEYFLLFSNCSNSSPYVLIGVWRGHCGCWARAPKTQPYTWIRYYPEDIRSFHTQSNDRRMWELLYRPRMYRRNKLRRTDRSAL